MMGFGMGFDIMSAVFPVIFIVMFIIVAGTFAVTAVRGVSTWGKNNSSPRLTVSAQVVAKRMSVSHHHGQDNMGSSFTSYYATFQVESGDRMEFSVNGPEYGMLAEGDRGTLSFQGTRYLSFQRDGVSAGTD